MLQSSNRRTVAAMFLLASLSATSAAHAQSPPARDPFKAHEVEAVASRSRPAPTVQLPEQRDPFVAFRAPVRSPRPLPPVPGATHENLSPPPQPEAESQPTVTVHGILESVHGNLAILTSSTSNVIVKAGDMVGNCQVRRINHGDVVVTCNAQTYRLPLGPK